MLKQYYRVGKFEGVSRGHPFGLVIGEVSGDKIVLGFSLCSIKDTYDGRKANHIAAGRLASGKFTVPVDNYDQSIVPMLEDRGFGELTDVAVNVCKRLLRKRSKGDGIQATG